MNWKYLLLPLIVLSCQKKEALILKGTCLPSASLEIKSDVPGRILSVYVQEGQLINEGDLLFTLDPRMYEAIRDRFIAERLQNVAKLQYAAEKVARYKTLLSENYVSQLDYIQYVSTLADLEAAVMKNEADIRIATIQLDACQIKAPFRGVIGKHFISKGSLITNTESPLMTLDQIDPIYIDFPIPKQIKNTKDLMLLLSDSKEKPILIDDHILRVKFMNPVHTFYPAV